VKTTLEIPDSVFRMAKATVAELGIPLREFVTTAVQEKLSSPKAENNKPWMQSAGSLHHLHEENVRIGQLVEETFRKIEPEDWF
jgi:hypothetical protein